jgi:predicted metalloprotease with PDZ domain
MSVDYHVALDPARHELRVTMRLRELAAGTLSLTTPTWVPGDYVFATYGRDLFDVRAERPDGGAVPIRRQRWSGYSCEHGAGALTVSYRAAAGSIDFSEACGVLGDRNGVLLGTRYLRVARHDGPCTVHYEVPAGWQIHHPAGARQVGPHSWEYTDYEQLLDTPVAFGLFDLITREVRGTAFHHVFLTRGVGYEDGVDGFIDRLCEVAASYHDMFGAFPFDSYTYVLSLDPNDSWGLEHLSGAMVGLDPATFYDEDQYKVGIRVCAHELFHAWNVRRLRPHPLGALDLEHGCFSQGLWVAEGFTRYYEFLSCTRTGVYSAGQFFSAVANYYAHLVALPAYGRVSPADASAASYLNHDKYPGRANSAIDYYDAGMVIAFELDASLRGAAPPQSLDGVFAAFYHAYAGRGGGYTVAQLCGFVDECLPGLGERLGKQALEPAGLDLPASLRRLGFSVGEAASPYVGLILQNDTGPAIYSVLDTGPAGDCGLAAADVITAVNGAPYSLEALRWAAAHETAVVLDVLRGNQARTCTIIPGTRTALAALAWNGSPAQAGLIAQWLRYPFAPSPGQAFPLDFYENFHGIETVI